MTDVVVIGAGIGGLASAIALASAGRRVELWESAAEPGGKAGTVEIDGLRCDTGPSVLTLPAVFDELLRRAGTRLHSSLELVESSPAFRYRWPDGGTFDVHLRLEDTVSSAEAAFGAVAARELRGFLDYARRVWEAARPHFVDHAAPALADFARMDALTALMTVDPFRSMAGAVRAQVRHPRLRDVLLRYATYNGSDPDLAPATLNCIAWVELGLGGYGIRGGMTELVRMLVDVALGVGVELKLGHPARELVLRGDRVVGVRGDTGATAARAVVANADANFVREVLLPRRVAPWSAPRQRSTSGWNAIVRVRTEPRAPHTVLFPTDYAAEFRDLAAGRLPADPTVYACAPSACHARDTWGATEPLFVMINAPAGYDGDTAAARELVLRRLADAGLAAAGDPVLWERSPAQLAARFPGTGGALYGAASNDRFAAFRRPANRIAELPGLYLASGSAHPGGGLPLCARSGLLAADAVLADLGAP